MPRAVFQPERRRVWERDPAPAARTLTTVLISYLPGLALRADVDQAEGQGDDDQQVAYCGPRAELGQQVAEAEAVGPGGEGGGGVDRAAARHDPDDVEHLEGVDQPEQQRDRGDRAQQREGDAAKALPRARPVQRRRLIEALRDRLQAAVEQDQVER